MADYRDSKKDTVIRLDVFFSKDGKTFLELLWQIINERKLNEISK